MSLIDAISAKRILVIGDIMLDNYEIGEVKRISPEAPVPVFLKRGEKSVLGGAANVAVNLATAGQSVSVLAFVGDDAAASRIRKLTEEFSIDTSLLIELNRITTVKSRFVASNNQQIMRLDAEDATPITTVEADIILNVLKSHISGFDLIILSDYMKGLLTEYLVHAILTVAHNHHVKVLVDVKDPNYAKYKGAYLLKPNLHELRVMTGMSAANDEEIVAASRWLLTACDAQYVLTTCGAHGMILVDRECAIFEPAICREVFDVTGAGDTTIAYLASCMANKLDMKQSIHIASVAAGIQVGKMGTSAVGLSEVDDEMRKDRLTITTKLISTAEASQLHNRYGSKKIVFTNGCFDILHIGHIRYLQEASKLGDLLIIGLNSDASIRRLKGSERPINPQLDRAEVLSALSCIDYVVIFDEDTPYELIRTIQPDVLIKGGDYKPENVVGRDIVEEHGGELVILPYVEGKSTTNILRAIKKLRIGEAGR